MCSPRKALTIVALLALASLDVPAVCAADTQATYFFNLPEQSLGDTLRAIGQQTATNILFDPETVINRIAPALHETLTASEAIERALQGSNLNAKQSANTILIRPSSSEAAGFKQSNAAKPTANNATASALRLAQSDPNASVLASEAEGQGELADSRRDSETNTQERLEEIVVTGTHIRGSQPAGARVIALGREEIDKSGYGRIEDVLATLPQTFGGNTEGNQALDANNLNRGSEIQLRGLGTGTTLVLVNGHRQASGGLQGSFVDISSVPLAAVERIEVLADGASALYGSDAIGGVVNIILRKDYQGAESRMRFATAGGHADEIQLSQVFGGGWSRGNALLGYQYSERGKLPAYARAASASNGNFTSRGGGDFRQSAGNPATVVDPSTGAPLYAIPEGQDGTNLTHDDLRSGANYTDFAHTFWMLPKQSAHSFFASASQSLTDGLELQGDLRFSSRDFTTLFGGATSFIFVDTSNPFFFDAYGDGTPFMALNYDFGDDFGPQRQEGATKTYAANIGLTDRLPGDWTAKLNASFARERNKWNDFNVVDFDALYVALSDPNPATAFNPFGDGSHTSPATIDAIRSSLHAQGRSTVKSLDLIFDGPALRLPAGAARLAIGASYRKEDLNTISESGRPADNNRHSSAVFAELAVPLVSEDIRRRALNRLELSVAGRYEDYNDFGATFDPKYGISWWPLESFKVRGTWSTSFRAPPFSLLSTALLPSVSNFRQVADAGSPGGAVNVLALAGGNPDLSEETATVWSAGFDFSPVTLAGFGMSLTYFNIAYRNKIASPSTLEEVLANPEQYSGSIITDPTPEQIDAVCSRADFLGDPASCTLPIGFIVDARYQNLAVTKVAGLDFDLHYARESAYGRWGLGVTSTYTFHNRIAVVEGAPSRDVIDTTLSPLSMKWRGSISWARSGWSADAFVNHQGSYDDTLSPTLRRVGAYTTVDVNLAYAIPNGHGWIDGTELSLSATNVFNHMPPFVNWFYGYDLANAKLLGRLTSVQIVKSW